jgi:anti-sigma factor (TIGR02949 family)
MTTMTSTGNDPMSCDEAVQVLWEYLDRELDHALRERVRNHLEQCRHCRSQYTFEGHFLRTVGSVVEAPIETTALRERILEALRGRGYHRRDK